VSIGTYTDTYTGIGTTLILEALHFETQVFSELKYKYIQVPQTVLAMVWLYPLS